MKQGQFTLPALPIVILLFTFTLPPETSISLGSLRLSPYRITLIFMLFPAINAVLNNTKTPFSFFDGLVIFHGIWATIALCINMGVASGIETGGIYFIETSGAYLVARAYIKTAQDFANVIKLVFTVTATLLGFAILESFTGFHILREPFKAVLGGAGPHYIEPRLGLTRAFTSFEHPILYGVFAASSFAGAYYLLIKEKIDKTGTKTLGTIVMATFFSLSGGPFTALAFQGGLIAWDRFTKGVANRWSILLGLFGFSWVILSLMSNRSPVLIFISYLTFSANSAYNRVHIWNYGTAEVTRHPLFGIGLNDWIRAPWMSSSMDNYWLLTTVRYGLPALLCLVIAIILIARRTTSRRNKSMLTTNARKAWIITILGFTLAGLTVHFWNALMVQFFFLLGCGAAVSVPALVQRRKPQIRYPSLPLKEKLA
ncbi:O-antigen ligase family protein [Kordiimonas laminariae]|uniref:O-antigen ligase family protein n=1 Tax=Kordiimonas laminariae TaxID=2917717 RepID=UPI001FF280DD|nr:hypothetical protein [Kordiimonas laminariae]MCK0067846.1 hypothetical protein [Kordiimonas laminariae]